MQGVEMAYGSNRVLLGIDLLVPRGQVLGYLGPNGAGKSTTVKILIGMLTPTAGTVTVAGQDVRRAPHAVKARVGYVPEIAHLYESLTAGEHLLLVGRLRGLTDDVVRGRGEALLAGFDLRGRWDSRIGTLSKGMRQRLQFCAALLHDPEVLLLDEPLSGLDAHGAAMVKELVRALAARGRTIFYCSHLLDVVERVCDRIVVLHGGRIVADGTYAELAERRAGGGTLEQIFLELTAGGGAVDQVGAILRTLGHG